ncbi:MAG: DUF3179 domain-containing protein [Planctomycetota bacterium]|nr:MAG: DUF3179 domain-containing protein [Planctomycetota bacterium]
MLLTMGNLRLNFLGAGLLLPTLALPAFAQDIFSEADYERNARQVIARDGFPVLNFPEMRDAAKADRELREDEPVIGVFLGNEAKAYPISVMGSHELANDLCGKIPIAVSW